MFDRTLTATTDDNGDYQLEGLPPGQYLVAVLPLNFNGTADQPLRHGWRRTFYPNAPDPLRAERLPVGSQTARADITLLAAPLSLISGTVIAESGRPAAGGHVVISHGDGFFALDSHSFSFGQDGRFAIPPQAPGTYFLLFHETPYPYAKGTIPLVSRAKVVVTTTDGTNVRVEPIHMVRITGRLVAPAGATGFDFRNMSIAAQPIDFEGNPGPTAPGPIQPDLSFSILAWPARVRVILSGPGATTWIIRKTALSGVEKPDGTLDAVANQSLAKVEIEVVRRGRGRSHP